MNWLLFICIYFICLLLIKMNKIFTRDILFLFWLRRFWGGANIYRKFDACIYVHTHTHTHTHFSLSTYCNVHAPDRRSQTEDENDCSTRIVLSVSFLAIFNLISDHSVWQREQDVNFWTRKLKIRDKHNPFRANQNVFEAWSFCSEFVLPWSTAVVFVIIVVVLSLYTGRVTWSVTVEHKSDIGRDRQHLNHHNTNLPKK
jgi:hypothetical protein